MDPKPQAPPGASGPAASAADPGRQAHNNRPKSAGTKSTSATTGLLVFDLWGQRGWAGQEVAGESHYTDTLKRVVGKAHSPQGAEHARTALLLPEKDNRHDPNAVAVHIDGHPVGHLPRDDASAYRPVLQRLADQGMVGQVAARVWASDRIDFDFDRRGNMRQSADFVASVRLDLAAPHLLVPGTVAPTRPHRMLPIGGSIQVTGEEEHADVLASYCGAAGEQWAHATLHEITQQLTRSTRTVVEVRIDDHRIGQLTPKMSGELLPALRHLADLGLATGCRAMVKGNRAASQVTLHVQRSHQLNNGWFDQVAGPTPAD